MSESTPVHFTVEQRDDDYLLLIWEHPSEDIRYEKPVKVGGSVRLLRKRADRAVRDLDEKVGIICALIEMGSTG